MDWNLNHYGLVNPHQTITRTNADLLPVGYSDNQLRYILQQLLKKWIQK